MTVLPVFWICLGTDSILSRLSPHCSKMAARSFQGHLLPYSYPVGKIENLIGPEHVDMGLVLLY